ncbi:hypothetical protein D3C81_718770 [compost metagenome]
MAAAGIAQHLEQVALFAGKVGVHGEHAAATQIALDGQGLECAARLELHRAATIHRQVGEVGVAGHGPGGVLQGEVDARVVELGVVVAVVTVERRGVQGSRPFKLRALAGQPDLRAGRRLGDDTVVTEVQFAVDQLNIQIGGVLRLETNTVAGADARVLHRDLVTAAGVIAAHVHIGVHQRAFGLERGAVQRDVADGGFFG